MHCLCRLTATLLLGLVPAITQEPSPGAQAPRLSYVITVDPTGRDGVRVSASVSDLPAGEHRWTVQRNYGSGKNLQLVDPVAFACNDGPVEERQSLGDWLVTHDGGEVRWSYTIRTDPAAHGLSLHDPGGGEMPQLSERFAFMAGALTLVRPSEWTDSGTIEIQWVLPDGWRVATPWGTEPRSRVPSLNALLDNYYVAFRDGAIATRDIDGFRLCVVWLGAGDVAAQAPLLDQLSAVFRASFEVFEGKPTSGYTLFIRDTTPPGSFEASPKSQTIQFNVPQGITLEALGSFGDQDGVNVLLATTAHEYFHTWGRRTELPTDNDAPEAGGAMRWFGEGFTEYFARYILFRAGVTDVAAFVNSMQSKYDGALRAAADDNLTLVTASEQFFANPQARQYCYDAGAAYAFSLDVALRRASEGSKSLAGFMRTFIPQVAEGRDDVEAFTDAWRAYAPSALHDLAADPMGATLPDIPDLLQTLGATSNVQKRLSFDSPAEVCDEGIRLPHVGLWTRKLGFMDSDVIVAMAGQKVTATDEFFKSLSAAPAPVQVRRGEQTLDLTLALEEQQVTTWSVPAQSQLAKLFGPP